MSYDASVQKNSYRAFLVDLHLYFAFCAIPVLVLRTGASLQVRLMTGLFVYLAVLTIGLSGFWLYGRYKRDGR